MVEEDKSISLTPGVTEEEISRKRSKTFYWTSILIVIIVALIYGVLWYYHWTINKEIEQINAQIQEEQSKIDAMGKEVDKLLSLKKRLDSLDKLLKERAVAWTPLLNKLGDLTVTGVRYSSLDVSKDGKVSLSGFAATAGDIARLLVSLEDNPPENPTPFKDVTLGSSVSYGSEEVPFSLMMTLKSGVLQKKSE